MRASLLVFFAALIFTGCSKPYDPPHIYGYTANFPGLKQYAQQGDTRIVWVHGMCSHTVTWANRRHALLANILGVPHSDREEISREPYPVVFQDQQFGNNIETRFLIWSPAFRSAKSRLTWDSASTDTRAEINQQVKKGLMNDCLADAVAYVGEPGDTVRDWMQEQFCEALGGHLNSKGGCNIHENNRRNVIFVSESLGSKMMSDALQSIWQSTPENQQPRLATALSNVQSVFLVANQIPILNVAEHPSTRSASTGRSGSYPGLQVLADVRKGPAARALNPLHFVEFTDPNDLLSYRLLDRDLGGDIEITNITVSNAPTYFGQLENPLNAHCGYQWNPYVLATIIDGYDTGAVKKLSTDIPKDACL